MLISLLLWFGVGRRFYCGGASVFCTCGISRAVSPDMCIACMYIHMIGMYIHVYIYTCYMHVIYIILVYARIHTGIRRLRSAYHMYIYIFICINRFQYLGHKNVCVDVGLCKFDLRRPPLALPHTRMTPVYTSLQIEGCRSEVHETESIS